MATARMKAREMMCKKLSESARISRKSLKSVIIDPKVDYDERMNAVIKLNKKPRDESLIRVIRRCSLCGRSRGVYRKFGLCRCCLRNAVMFGLVPGVRKASW